MTTKSDSESNLDPGSVEEGQTPNTSKGASDSPTSSLDAESVWKLLEPRIEKKLQSNKDSRLGRLESAVESFKPVLERVKGLIPAEQYRQLEHDLEYDEMKRRVFGEPQDSPSTAATPGKGEQGAADEVSRVVDSVLNLPANDPRVTQLKIDHGKDPKAYLENALQLFAKIGRKEESTPGEQPTLAGGGPVSRVENPIETVEDPHELYRMAADQLVKQASGRKRAVPS